MKYHVGQTFKYKGAPWLTPTLQRDIGDGSWVILWNDNQTAIDPWTNIWPETGMDEQFIPINNNNQLPEDLFSL